MKEDDFLKWNGEYLVPRRVTIETIFGCNAKCAMCVINHPTERKKGIMPRENFHRIVDSITPYRDDFKMFDLFGLGEPLLDPYIFDRIRYVKKKGFKSLAISTNADLLSPDKQKALLDSGIETVLFSIDGIKKATHESIRHGVNFNRVVKNVTDVIRKRDAGGYQTRFIMRFVSQPENKGEWDAYKSFWEDKLTKEKNDFVTAYDMHSWGGEIASKERRSKTGLLTLRSK